MSGTGNPSRFIPSSGNPFIDGVLTFDAWAEPTIYYAFSLSSSPYSYGSSNSSLPANFNTISLQQEVAVNFALSADVGTVASRGFSVEGLTNLNVTYLGEANSTTAHIRFGETSSSAVGTAEVADFPGNYVTSNVSDNGDVWFGTAFNYRAPEAGNYAWATHIHEIGHAMGLKHGHDAFGSNGALPSTLDSMEYSIMTYRSYPGAPVGPDDGYTNETWGFAQTFMMFDIAALQYMYGADYLTNAGNTTYKWNPGSGDTLVNGSVGIDAGGNRIFATIWDGGGNDTYDLSSYTAAVMVDLRPGAYSVFSQVQLAGLGDGHFARGNIFNALLHNGDLRSLIENASGGSGNDKLVGNNGANALMGNGGNDTLIGGAGADVLNGGSGSDTADYSASTAVLVRLFNGTGVGGEAQGDTLSSIEVVIGSAFADTLVGSANIDSLLGGNGNDGLYGLGGNDYLHGGYGADILNGGAGIDMASYAGSTGVLVRLFNGTSSGGMATGDSFNSIENVMGSSFADTLVGSDGANYLRGEGGGDYLAGRAGADLLSGGTGFDTALYNGSNAVLVKLYAGTGQFGDAQGDTLISIESVVGSSFNDTIIGSNGPNIDGFIDNKLDGGAGNDALFGLAGNDILIGGAGADALDGGDDADFASYEGSNAGVTVRLFNGTASGGHATGDTFTSIEGLIGSSHNDTLFGDAANNDLRGGAGNDYINGMGGNDTIRGGAAADILDGGTGFDLVDYTGSSAGVTVRLFNQTATGGDATGDVLSNFEDARGSAFNDTLIGDDATGGNYLYGGGGNDYLNGLGDSDWLFGEAGADLLEGGAGFDLFNYQSISDSTVAAAGRDRIVDFSQGGDQINVSLIDANPDLDGEQAFTFRGAGSYTGMAGELRYVQGGGSTYILADVDGDMVSDFAIQLDGTINLTSGDFLL